MKKKFNTRQLITIAILASMAGVLMFPIFEIQLPFLPPFYKLDFSEIPVLIGAFAIHPLAGVIIEVIKILIALIIKGGSITMGVGEFANLLIGIAYVVPASYIYHKHKTRKNAIIGLCVGTLSIAVIGAILNAFVLLPVYAYFFGMDMSVLIAMGTAVNGGITNLFTFVIFATVPFNLIKGVLVSLIVIVIYKRISHLIKAKDRV